MIEPESWVVAYPHLVCLPSGRTRESEDTRRVTLPPAYLPLLLPAYVFQQKRPQTGSLLEDVAKS